MLRGLVILLIAAVAACAAAGCKSHSDRSELHVPPQSYKSHENYVLFGKLTACPLADHESQDGVRFVVTPKDGTNVVLLNEELGDFMFTPSPDFVGIVTFWYHVERGPESSEPSTVTVNVQRRTVRPSLNVSQHVVGLEDGDTELDIVVVDDDLGSGGLWEDLSVAICNCAHDVTCDREREDCHCHLSLPNGWEIFNGPRRLTLAELNSLPPTTAENLVLRAAPSSAAEHCLAVHVINPAYGDDPSVSKEQMNIHIHPVHSTVVLRPHGHHYVPQPEPVRPGMGTGEVVPPPQPIQLSLNTTEGRPYVFHDLRVLDMGGVEGTYFVTVRLDQGGLLWVRQDLREDVVFIPPTVEITPDEVLEDKVYELLHRFGTFRTGNRPLKYEKTNNGIKLLRFIGSLEGINEVLSTLTFVPWCSEWPTPPSWPLPERSWMDVAGTDPALDPHHPHIWPQWYPRFWYPFPSHHWSWWPRVLPPWWMTTVCSNWTSRVHLRVREIPAVTCSQKESEQAATPEWSADIAVIASGNSPKSLVTK